MAMMPSPSAIEHAEPGGRQLHEAHLVADAVVVVGVEADLVDVEAFARSMSETGTATSSSLQSIGAAFREEDVRPR